MTNARLEMEIGSENRFALFVRYTRSLCRSPKTILHSIRSYSTRGSPENHRRPRETTAELNIKGALHSHEAIFQNNRNRNTDKHYIHCQVSSQPELTQLVSVRRYAVSYTFNQLVITIYRSR